MEITETEDRVLATQPVLGCTNGVCDFNEPVHFGDTEASNSKKKMANSDTKDSYRFHLRVQEGDWGTDSCDLSAVFTLPPVNILTRK